MGDRQQRRMSQKGKYMNQRTDISCISSEKRGKGERTVSGRDMQRSITYGGKHKGPPKDPNNMGGSWGRGSKDHGGHKGRIWFQDRPGIGRHWGVGKLGKTQKSMKKRKGTSEFVNL